MQNAGNDRPNISSGPLQTSRFSLWLSRLLDVILLSLSASAIVFLAYPWLRGIGIHIAQAAPIQYLPVLPAILTVCFALIISLYWVPLFPWSWLRLHTRAAWKSYPPFWLAVPGPLFLVKIAEMSDLLRPHPVSVWVWLGATLVLAYGFSIAQDWIISLWETHNGIDSGGIPTFEQSNIPAQSKAARLGDLTDAEFEDWFMSEKPIHEPKRNLFGFQAIINQLTGAITDRKIQSVGLTGPFGSGKTSVINLTIQQLKNKHNDERWVFAHVSEWGYSDGAGEQAILSAAIKAISRHMDVLGLIQIPQQYLDTLKDCTPNWARPLMFSLNLASAEDRLAKLNNALKCIDYKLVLFIEDIDRNYISDEHKKKTITQLASLLDRLKALDHIKFVMAITDLGDPSLGILDRLFERQISMPDVERNDIENAVERIRAQCQRFSSNDILPVWYESFVEALSKLANSDEGFDLGTTNVEDHPLERRRKYSQLDSDVFFLLSNPRTLKTVLRHVWLAWKNLHGEIVLEELLLITLIRHVSPIAYRIMNHDRTDFPFDSIQNSDHEKKDQRLYLDSWNDKVTDVGLIEKQSLWAIWKVIKPSHYFAEQGIFGTGLLAHDNQLKWRHIHQGELPRSGVILDQRIFSDWTHWRNNRDDALAERLQDPDYARAFESLFDKRVNNSTLRPQSDEILDLASQVFRLLLRKHGAEADDENIAYETITKHKPIPADSEKEEYRRWLYKEIKLALQKSLSFAWCLEIQWGGFNDESPSRSLLTQEQCKKLRLMLREWIHDHTRDNSEWFKSVISNKSARLVNSLRYFVFQSLDKDAKDVAVPLSKWNFIVERIISSLESSPSSLLPSSCCLVVKSAERLEHKEDEDRTPHVRFIYSVDRRLVCTWVKDIGRRSAFLDAILGADKPADRSDWGVDVQTMVGQVIADLRKWRDEGYAEPIADKNRG